MRELVISLSNSLGKTAGNNKHNKLYTHDKFQSKPYKTLKKHSRSLGNFAKTAGKMTEYSEFQ